MSRSPTPADIDTAPAAARPLLEAVKRRLGSVLNLFRIAAISPAALEGYLGLDGALAKGAFDARTRERIALAVAEIDGCDYRLSARSYLASNLAKLDAADIAANRASRSNDAKTDATVKFAAQIVRARGHIADADLAAVKAAGFDDAQVVEIVAHVALNTLTNDLNEVLGAEIDFPVARRAAA